MAGRIDHIDSIEVSDSRHGGGENVESLFTVVDGVMRARNQVAAYARILEQSRIGRPVFLTASASDTDGRSHYGVVEFYVGRFKLTGTLVSPPSNPALPVANVPVRVSVMGSGVTVRRISDAQGRFEVDGLPDATIAFEAHTVAAGIHYYADATVTLCADRSVLLPMLNVKDLVARAPRLIIESAAPECPPVPGR